tara:strand:+ start:5145 stop:5498 length:354 start_codon:yes stop_codon:yes gene_type:complete
MDVYKKRQILKALDEDEVTSKSLAEQGISQDEVKELTGGWRSGLSDEQHQEISRRFTDIYKAVNELEDYLGENHDIGRRTETVRMSSPAYDQFEKFANGLARFESFVYAALKEKREE